MKEKDFWFKMSIILSVIIILLIGVGIYICSRQPDSKEEVLQMKESNDVLSNTPDIFVYKIGELPMGSAFILVDKETRVEYLYISSGVSSAPTVTARIDSVGKPILYRRESPK